MVVFITEVSITYILYLTFKLPSLVFKILSYFKQWSLNEKKMFKNIQKCFWKNLNVTNKYYHM